MHPLYHHARRLVGQLVHVHHVNGRVYTGYLHHVVPSGIYVTPARTGVGMAKADAGAQSVHFTDRPQGHDIHLAYSPGWYFGWGALAGLSVAALAAPFMW